MATLMDSKTQKITTVTSTGKQEETSMMDVYGSKENIRFVSDDGDIVSVPSQSPTQILVNGTEAARFSVPIKSKERLFIMPDIKKSVYYAKGKIYKADGTEQKLTNIIFPKFVQLDGAITCYYYKVYKNDAGIKEIYLCKYAI
jgi:hypothetical protein